MFTISVIDVDLVQQPLLLEPIRFSISYLYLESDDYGDQALYSVVLQLIAVQQCFARLVSCLENVLPQPELLISQTTSSFLVNLNMLFLISLNVG